MYKNVSRYFLAFIFCPWAALFRAANTFRVTWSERVRHRNALTEIAWGDAVQGLGIKSTVASEKNKEMLFIRNVVYKQ